MRKKIIGFSFIIIIFGMFLLNILGNNTIELLRSSVASYRSNSYVTYKEKLGGMVKALEDTYNENINYKDKIGTPTSVLDYELFNKIHSNATLLGKDKWLFYQAIYDGRSIDDYQGINLYDEETMSNVKNNYDEAKKYYDDKGINFNLMICPNKEQIYSEFMPSSIQVVSNEKRIDKLINYLEDNNVSVINPKTELLERKKEAQVYYKNDTHWNKVGGFIGSQCINDAILGRHENFDPSKVYDTGETPNCDLLNVIGLSKYNKDIDYSYHSDYSDVNAQYTEVSKGLWHYISNAENHKTVLVMGDSFVDALENWLPNYYDSVYFIHRDLCTSEMIEQIKPDEIVFEVIERQLDELQKPMYR